MNATSVHILYVITDLELGGVPLHLHRLVRAMRGRGLEPSVVSLAGAGPVARVLRGNGVRVHSCRGRGRLDFRVIARLAKVIRQTHPDVVHAMLFHANVAARCAARLVGFPKDRVVCEIQTVEVERQWHLLIDRFTHGGCRFTIGNSPSVIEHLAARAKIPRDRLRLVRGGIDPVPLRDAKPVNRSTLGFAVEGPIVFWAGRLDPVKGLEVLIRAFRTLVRVDRLESRSHIDTGAHLLLAGDGPLRNRLVEQIRRLGLTGRVHLLGPRDDIPALLKAATVFALPSRTEGLPNALLEAMAAGCPVVTTDVPGCRDLIEHDRTGLLVPYGDAEALVGAIRLLLTDHGTARRLARAAAELVTKSWHIEQTYEAYAAIYQGAVSHQLSAGPSADD